ncbi:MAG: PepSY domain-containing protein, partial [Maricaulaceae bacterium]
MSPTDAAAPTQAAGSPESLARRARRVLSPVRLIFLVHRWLGIGLGILMAVWCLSGFVMMYVGYPEMTEPDRRAGLAPIDWSTCCTTPTWLALGGEEVRSARIEMRAGLPLMYWRDGAGAAHVTNLATGGDAPPVDAAAARAIASDYAARLGLAGAPADTETLAYDQWTMLPAVRALGPFFKVNLDDDAGSQIYVSSGSGAVAAATSARERFWNWPGAVTHWLYFTELRKRSDTWYWFVVWTSLLGCFLTGTGLYTGIRMFGRGRRQFSPYRGFSYVHHLAGLGFGLLAFTWVGSGLVSMNPWGFLEGQGARDEVARLQGGPAPSADVVGLLRALSANPPRDTAGGVVQIELQRLLGETGVIIYRADGSVARLDPRTLAPAPLGEDALARAAVVMLGEDA